MELAALTGIAMQTFYNVFFNNNNDSESDDNEDEEICNIFIKRYLRRVGEAQNIPSRIRSFVELTLFNCNDQEFQNHFRVSREAFEWLLQRVSPDLESDTVVGRPVIDPRKQLLAVLWLLATPDSYRSLGDRFNLGKASVFVSFIRVIKALNKLAPAIIQWPHGERARIVEQQFFNMAGIRGVLGAIDGSYIPIKAPSENPEVYVNRKCFHAITLQVICDSERKFTDCFTGYPSSVSDVRIFKNSDIYQKMLQNPDDYFQNEQFIIGDKAYPVRKWCIPPYIDRGNLLQFQKNFNTLHAKTRQIVERSFALLFGRFRRLRFLDMNRVDLIPATIIACCVLHNVCLNNNGDLPDIYEREGMGYVQGNEEENLDLNIGEVPVNRNLGVHLRNTIARGLYRH